MSRSSRYESSGIACLLALGLGCGRREATRTPPPRATTAEVASHAPRPPRTSDVVLLAMPSVAGPMATETLLRDARMLAAPLRACTAPMADGATFELDLSVDDVGILRDIRYRPAALEDADLESCVLEALRSSRVGHSMESGATAQVTLRFGAVARPQGIAVDPARACQTDDECVFVHGDCTRAYAVHRVHATDVDAASRRRATDCASQAPEAHAERLACMRGMCDALEEPHPELRACTSDAQCTTLTLEDGRSTAVARRSAARAREQLGARAPADAAAAPAASCVYGACTLGWAGTR